MSVATETWMALEKEREEVRKRRELIEQRIDMRVRNEANVLHFRIEYLNKQYEQIIKAQQHALNRNHQTLNTIEILAKEQSNFEQNNALSITKLNIAKDEFKNRIQSLAVEYQKTAFQAKQKMIEQVELDIKRTKEEHEVKKKLKEESFSLDEQLLKKKMELLHARESIEKPQNVQPNNTNFQSSPKQYIETTYESDHEQVTSFEELKKWKEKTLSPKKSIVQSEKKVTQETLKPLSSIVLENPPMLSIERLIEESKPPLAPPKEEKSNDRLKSAFEKAMQNSALAKSMESNQIEKSKSEQEIKQLQITQSADSLSDAVIIDKPSPTNEQDSKKRKSNGIGAMISSLLGKKKEEKLEEAKIDTKIVSAPNKIEESKPEVKKEKSDEVKLYMQSVLPSKIVDTFSTLGNQLISNYYKSKSRKTGVYSTRLPPSEVVSILKSPNETDALKIAAVMCEIIKQYPEPMLSSEMKNNLLSSPSLSKDFLKKHLGKAPLRMKFWDAIASHLSSIQEVDSKAISEPLNAFASIIADNDTKLTSKVTTLLKNIMKQLEDDEEEEDEEEEMPKRITTPKFTPKPVTNALSKLKSKKFVDSDDDDDDDFSPAVNISNSIQAKPKSSSYDPHDF